MIDFVASFSAALAVWGWGATGFGLLRLREVWRDGNRRRNLILLGAILIAAGIGLHQSMAWWAWEVGAWRGASSSPIITVGYRVAWAAGLLALAGAASWPRCGHKGWQALTVIGAVAWAAAWAI